MYFLPTQLCAIKAVNNNGLVVVVLLLFVVFLFLCVCVFFWGGGGMVDHYLSCMQRFRHYLQA